MDGSGKCKLPSTPASTGLGKLRLRFRNEQNLQNQNNIESEIPSFYAISGEKDMPAAILIMMLLFLVAVFENMSRL